MDVSSLPFSRFSQSGSFVFLSGQIGLKNGRLVTGGVEPELRQAVSNAEDILREAGLALQQVISVEVFLSSFGDYELMNEVYAVLFSAPYPARTCVGVRELPFNARVEIKITASFGS